MRALSFEEALRDLRERFVRGSVERLERIAQLLDTLEREPADAGALRDLMIQFHGFAGAGSTYGFPGVSALGSEGERLCDALLKEKQSPQTREQDRWMSLLRSLRRELKGEPSLGPPAAPSGPETRSAFDILVVDSDPESRASLERAALRDGMSARTAGTRAEAEAALNKKIPDGAIVELSLSDGSGSGFVEKIRALPGGESLAILMIGGASGFVNRVDAIHCGADGYFDKPVREDALMRRLEHLLERGRTEAPRVLSVEDDADQAAFVRAVLLDIQLPGTDGYALARYIRQQESHAALPILFLTTRSHIDSQIESMRAGGDDYLVKPVMPGLLLSAAAARIERARFLRNLLERDGLTRLLTHTAFLERARMMATERTDPSKTPPAMVLLDLDGFKALNDSYGHPVGDTVLVSLAGLLRRRLRQSDVVGRLGGDEFAAIIENIGERQAVRLLERVREEFAGLDQAGPDGSHFRATFSAGVAILGPGMDANAWRKRADETLYAAKSKGKNRVTGAAG